MLKNPLTYLFLTVIACLIIVTGCEKEALTVPQTSPKAITKFTFESAKNPSLKNDLIGSVSPGNRSIYVDAPPFDANLEGLIPTINISEGATISPASGKVLDFRSSLHGYAPVEYTVTGSDGIVNIYKVLFKKPIKLSSPTLVINYSEQMVPIVKEDGSGVELRKVLPADFDRAKDSLKLSFTVSAGATLKEGENKIVLDKKTHKATKNFSFSSSLSRVFTVTVVNGRSTPLATKYMLTVVERTNASNDIVVFSILKSENPSLAKDVIGVIDASSSTITLDLPGGTDSTLVPTIEHNGKSISSAEKAKDKKQDFSKDVIYKVKSSDGNEKSYTVKTTALPYMGRGLSVQIENVNSFNIGNKFTRVLPKNVLKSAENKVTMTLSVSKGATLKEESTDLPLKDGSYSQLFDFSASLSKVFTVTSQEGKEAQYTVDLNVQGDSTKDVLYFVFLGRDNPSFYNNNLMVIGVVDAGTDTTGTITAKMPQYTNVANLTPFIIHNGASISPGSGKQGDFRDVKGKKYTVTASDKTTKEYTVIVQETR